jgi:hypothetical protein
MNKKLKMPPKNKKSLTSPDLMAKKLSELIGTSFKLTKKSRTDGSNMRKLIGSILINNSPIPSEKNTFNIIPPKAKGVPKILLEYVDSYIVTSGVTYNLQVWNRNPSVESVQIEYQNGDVFQSSEVRFILTRVNPVTNIIDSIAILTPEYIVKNFGTFGKPTIKGQIIISSKARTLVLSKPNSILFYDDYKNIGNSNNLKNIQNFSIHDEPSDQSLLPLCDIKKIIIEKILGQLIESDATKNRGQKLERLISEALGYKINDNELLAGGYPDIRNQALEVKLQDSATVDLGKYSPEYIESVPNCANFHTRNMRYLIVLTNPSTNIVEGAILCSGGRLGKYFTYVSEKSYKCQRTIPMSFFEGLQGQSVFNPKLPVNFKNLPD